MKLVEKQIYYERKANINYYYNHKIRGWIYAQISNYYERKRLRNGS